MPRPPDNPTINKQPALRGDPEKAQLKKLAALLGQACYSGHLDTVRQILALKPALTSALAADWSPIMNASFAGHSAIVQELLSAGADPNIISKTGHRYRPLHRALEHKKTVPKHPGHLDTLHTLLHAGADPLARGTWKMCSAVAVAAANGDPVLLQPLLRAIPTELSIFDAAATANLRLVQKHLKRDPHLARKADINGMTALMYCADSRLWSANRHLQDNLTDIARALIDAGADVNAEMNAGNHTHPVSLFAVASPPVMRVLIRAGARPDRAVTSALWEKDFDTLDLLLAAGADCSKPPLSDKPAHFAHWGSWDAARWLIDHGADPNSAAEQGSTPLIAAARRGASPDFVAFVLAKGGDPHLQNDAGRSALDLAKAYNRTKLLPLLQAAPAPKSHAPAKPRRTAEDDEFEADLPDHMKATTIPAPGRKKKRTPG